MVKMTFNSTWGYSGNWTLFLDDIDATKLPSAPPLGKDNIDPVCRSEVIEFNGETITRKTWLLFIKGLRVPFEAEFNRRMKTGAMLVNGKSIYD